jgi:hypothetical protein
MKLSLRSAEQEGDMQIEIELDRDIYNALKRRASDRGSTPADEAGRIVANDVEAEVSNRYTRSLDRWTRDLMDDEGLTYGQAVAQIISTPKGAAMYAQHVKKHQRGGR